MWFYGVKAMGFLFGAKRQYWYTPVYLALLVGGAVVSMDIVNGLILASYATMAIPTMISALYLAPKVNRAAAAYFAELKNNWCAISAAWAVAASKPVQHCSLEQFFNRLGKIGRFGDSGKSIDYLTFAINQKLSEIPFDIIIEESAGLFGEVIV